MLWRYDTMVVGGDSFHKNMGSWIAGLLMRWLVHLDVLSLSFSNNLKYTIGNGGNTSSWNELWIGEENLKTIFPDTYILSLQHMDKVALVWSPQGSNLIFRRALNVWEINREADLLQVLIVFQVVNALPDLPVWKLHHKRSFTVKSCYWRLNYSCTLQLSGLANWFGR